MPLNLDFFMPIQALCGSAEEVHCEVGPQRKAGSRAHCLPALLLPLAQQLKAVGNTPRRHTNMIRL